MPLYSGPCIFPAQEEGEFYIPGRDSVTIQWALNPLPLVRDTGGKKRSKNFAEIEDSFWLTGPMAI